MLQLITKSVMLRQCFQGVLRDWFQNFVRYFEVFGIVFNKCDVIIKA